MADRDLDPLLPLWGPRQILPFGGHGRPRFGRSRSRTRCLKTGRVCYLSSCEKLQKTPACFWNCSTHVLRDITKVGENRFTMPVRGEKLLQNVQFINKLIELCSKGRFDMFTEEETDPVDHRSAVRPEGNRHCAKSVHRRELKR